MVYKLAYRQTEGFLHSIASLLGLGIEIPDYSTLSRRSRLLRKKLRIPKAASNQPIHLMMLQYALEREVTEALGRNYYENAPATTKEKGRRNGYESHRVLTGEGAVTVQVPRVRETEKVFQSKILDAYVSRTEKLDELIARMYVHGMSTRDIEATFADVLSGTGVSKSVVSRVTRCLSEDFEAFRKRDLSNEKLLYLELDGTYLRYHQGAERKEPILVATGYRADGREFFFISVSATENPTRTGRGSCRRWWPEE